MDIAIEVEVIRIAYRIRVYRPLGYPARFSATEWARSNTWTQRAWELAQKHRVGFYNLSDESSDIWVPGSTATLTKLT
jgi:hypothetical protein